MWNNNNIPRYQTGSYIPGLSSQIFGAGLSTDVRKTQDDLYGKGSKLGERSFYDKIGGMFGGRGGKALAKWGMGALGVTNPWLKLAIPALGAAAGAYGLPKLFGGKDKKYESKTGLLGSQYDKLSKHQDVLGEERKGRAAGYGLEGLYEGLTSDVGKELWGDVQSKYGWGEYGKAAAVDPSQALKNIGKLPSPPQLGMKAQPPAMGDYEDFSKGGFGKGESMYEKGFKGSLDIDKPYSDIDFLSQNTNVLEGLGKEMPSGTEPEMLEYMSAKLGSENPLDVNFLPTGSDFSPDEYPMEYPSSVESPNIPKGNLAGMLGSGAGHMSDLLTKFLGNRGMNFGNAGKGQVWPKRYYQEGGPVGMQTGGAAYPLQMAGGGYMPEQGYGGLIQHRKGY